ncbi:hypothetical protein [Pseudomonas amygdali]|uniref:Glycine zipper 2TM domain-containing protein n=2 Tax=Pseudomonas amygdali pv. lachrymans TaxID=53707 RepID=A0ABR5KQL0_PSEAV|nr:hypothetical protein [Pseudomonas amygdali]AXH59518.1 hypothetical protein PLA107_030285 [Pseudomonas amygdali pv. lachrymans str. M301315]KPC16945.1 Uncharacterized protein AC499_0147 [Pseudomonas amygdali pv. lachrymans]KPC17904.1 Uncharacterized protein AC499_1106 [Pseudomonas amygdali pv. lachrymans]RMT06116.1 hypothetical protein ALP54_03444 [Pseudomonas amygdali pv. lachrymans]
MRKTSLLCALALAASITGCAAPGTSYQQPTRLDVGRIVDVQKVATNGSWGTGAAIGGVAGLLTGGGHSTESKVIRAGVGALAGAAINKALTTGQMETQLVVQNRYGQMFQVIHDHSDMYPGDCVQIQTRYDGQMKIYRTSPTQCNF